MYATLHADDLRAATTILRRLRIRATLPILDQVLVTIAGSTAVLGCTDLDIAVRVRLDLAGPSTEGSFTLPRAELFTLAKQADKGSTVQITVDDMRKAVIHSITKRMNSKREYIALNPEDFPPIPAPEDRTCILPTATLDAVRLARPAASGDETRYVLNGVYLDPRGGGYVVATDGRRCVTSPGRVPHDDAILPNAVADLLVDPACAGPAIWHRNSDAGDPGFQASLTFAGGKTRLLFKLIEGNFPNWRQVIPSADLRRASYTFAPSTAASLVTWLRAAPMDTVKMEPGPSSVICSRVSDKTGDTRSTLTVPAAVAGDPPDAIAFNSRFLSDALAMGLHTLDLIDEMSPGVATNGATRCVVMPMRVTGPVAPEAAVENEPSAEEPEPATADA